MIRVLIAEDSLVVSKLLASILSSDPNILVVGIARDGAEAKKAAKDLDPDVITMDIHMPVMDGVEATKQIMAYSPKPILILSSSIFAKGPGAEEVFRALQYGAVDVMEKNLFEGDHVDEQAKNNLIARVKMLSRVKVITHPLAKFEGIRKSPAPGFTTVPPGGVGRRIVGIASSTGGPQALSHILSTLPMNYPVPIVIVQHISAGFASSFVEWLNTKSMIPVKAAENDEAVSPGHCYVSPHGVQMRVTREGKINLADGPPVCGECPSGTVLLQSLAAVYGARALGVILSGMGRDGAEGIKAIHDARGLTIAQDEKTCAIYGMPAAAVELEAVDEILPLPNIAARIVKWLKE